MDAAGAMELFAKTLTAFDRKIGINDRFYYSLPYVRDYDLCNSIPHQAASGNVLKWYRVKVNEPVIIITDAVDTDYTEADDADEDIMDEAMEDEFAESSEEVMGLTDEEAAMFDEGGYDDSDFEGEAWEAPAFDD